MGAGHRSGPATLAIPRGQIALAAGHAEPSATKLVLKAERGPTDYGICSTTFLELAFRTDSYAIEVDFHADGSWSYVSDTTLVVRGQDAPFLHRDRNTLVKVAEPEPNPLARIFERRRPASRWPRGTATNAFAAMRSGELPATIEWGVRR